VSQSRVFPRCQTGSKVAECDAEVAESGEDAEATPTGAGRHNVIGAAILSHIVSVTCSR
jgi:hypothetical protein